MDTVGSLMDGEGSKNSTLTNVDLDTEASHNKIHRPSEVFSTFELLEAILLHVPNSTLLQAQRVNTTFQRVICRSAELQEKLFFRQRRSTVQLVINPLLRQSGKPKPGQYRIRLNSRRGRIIYFDAPLGATSERHETASWTRMVPVHGPMTPFYSQQVRFLARLELFTEYHGWQAGSPVCPARGETLRDIWRNLDGLWFQSNMTSTI